MYELTLSGLINLGSSYYVQDEANWMIIEVQAYDDEPEIIVNPKENFNAKLHYYSEAYNEDLTLKSNPNIKIVKYDFAGAIQDYL